MGFRFRRSIRLGKGLRLNLSKSGISASFGRPGTSLNVGTHGTSATVGIPGTGLSYRAFGHSGGKRGITDTESVGSSTVTGSGSAFGCLGAAAVLLGGILLLAGAIGWGTLFVALAILLLVLQTRKSEAAARARDAAAQLRAAQEAQRHAELTTRFGAETCARIVAHEIWLGQSSEQLSESRGTPIDVDVKVMQTKRREIWKYDQIGQNRFKTRVTLENGLVTGWEQK